MNKCMLSVAVSAVAVSALAVVPEVSDIVSTQDSGSRKVKVEYTLANEPAIVTLSVETNGPNGWVSIGDENLTYVAGDANKIVQPGARSLTWAPHKAWPNQFINDGNIRVGVKAWATNAPPEIMAVNLKAEKTVHYYSSAAALPGGVTNDLYKTDILVMRLIPAGNVTWTMGSPVTEPRRDSAGTAVRETPHEVTLGDDYYIGVYPVTQRQYELIAQTNPSKYKNSSDYATRPAEWMSFEALRGKASDGYDYPNNGHVVKSNSFIGTLRAFSGVDGFDLPTDAQWEFACRAGCGNGLYNGTEVTAYGECTNLNVLGRYQYNGGYLNGVAPAADSNADHGSAKVGTYLPNDWGLYDMLGNVQEWCLDWYKEASLDSEGKSPTSGTERVMRGGSYNSVAAVCRCACRDKYAPGQVHSAIGFRLACSK